MSHTCRNVRLGLFIFQTLKKPATKRTILDIEEPTMTSYRNTLIPSYDQLFHVLKSNALKGRQTFSIVIMLIVKMILGCSIL